jgi:hypothetical protein
MDMRRTLIRQTLSLLDRTQEVAGSSPASSTFKRLREPPPALASTQPASAMGYGV